MRCFTEERFPKGRSGLGENTRGKGEREKGGRREDREGRNYRK